MRSWGRFPWFNTIPLGGVIKVVSSGEIWLFKLCGTSLLSLLLLLWPQESPTPASPSTIIGSFLRPHRKWTLPRFLYGPQNRKPIKPLCLEITRSWVFPHSNARTDSYICERSLVDFVISLAVGAYSAIVLN